MSEPLSRDLATEATAALAKHGTKAAAARALGIPRTTLVSRLDAAAAYAKQDGDTPYQSDADKLKDQVKELEASLRAATSDKVDDRYVKSKIIGVRDEINVYRAPKWTLSGLDEGDAMPGVPVTLWSDWHTGEVVFPEQIGGVNEYNMDIFRARARKLVEKVIYLLRHHVVNPEFPGIVVNLGGDMLSGDIHDELSQSNEMPLMPVLLELFGVLKWALTAMADEFGNVFVPCVTGNHGRNTRKPMAKNRNHTNFDWLLYQFLAKAFENDARITFYIPDGPDALYRVFNHTYLLTHGDQFRGGDGIIGAIGPITRGNQRKQSRNSAIGREYDTMLLGHWHQYMPLHRTLVNGSLKGYDEYANQSNFGYEPPTQAMWLTHPTHGITIHMPIYLEQHAGRKEGVGDWVSLKEAA